MCNRNCTFWHSWFFNIRGCFEMICSERRKIFHERSRFVTESKSIMRLLRARSHKLCWAYEIWRETCITARFLKSRQIVNGQYWPSQIATRQLEWKSSGKRITFGAVDQLSCSTITHALMAISWWKKRLIFWATKFCRIWPDVTSSDDQYNTLLKREKYSKIHKWLSPPNRNHFPIKKF